jgi:hypothetical protein
MKASELKIGNYVIQGGEVTRVEQLKRSINDWDRTNHMRTMDCEPIPLTEEWLKKFCFISEDVRYTAWKKSSFFLNINRYGEYIFKAESAEYQIKYVHQLQNLFSCLLGMELIAEEFVYISKAEQ